MYKKLLSIVVLVLSFSASAIANNGSLLNNFVHTVQNAKGEFVQVALNDEGQAVANRQSGVFSFQRPGLFKWHVLDPFEQLTLSDGNKLYQYDPDLFQVIVRDVDDSLGTSPAAILFGSGQIQDSFKVQKQPDKQNLQWIKVTPRSNDAGFSYINIGFESDMPVQLLITDSFGQTTQIELLSVSTNTQLEDDEFTFTPPQDVDVVNM